MCILSTGALGTSAAVAVAASPACGEFVRTYVDRVERNLVSPTTMRRWREWGVKHPNWHPNPHLARRPKFKTVREEKLSHMQVDCQVLTPEIPLLTAALDTFLFAPAAPAFEQALNTPISAPLQAFQTPAGGTSIASIGSPGGGGGGVSAPGGGSPIASTPVSSNPISDPVPITPIAPVTPRTCARAQFHRPYPHRHGRHRSLCHLPSQAARIPPLLLSGGIRLRFPPVGY